MELVFSLILGACVGLIIGILIGLELAVKPDVNHQVDDLNSQAQKSLNDFQETQCQIAHVSQKAETAHRDLKSKITELANQE
ncbi:MAG TPA: hypothetical protein PLE88_10965 [Anaerohalosphaeraceae bacterium]|nr:hypothetical protein [Anaerohalosphaeraceae bacterium]